MENEYGSILTPRDEMTAPLTASESHFDLRVDYATRRIAISGEFDIATAPNLAIAVAAVQRAADGDITIDLDDVRSSTQPDSVPSRTPTRRKRRTGRVSSSPAPTQAFADCS